MTWYNQAKDIAKNYESYRKELDILLDAQQNGLHKANVLVVSGRRISKPVEAAVLKTMSNDRMAYLQKAIDAVDYAKYRALEKPEGEITLKIFELVYGKHNCRLFAAAGKLNLSERTAERYNHFFLKMIAIKMGYYPIL